MAQLTRQMLIAELAEQARADEEETQELKDQNKNFKLTPAVNPAEKRKAEDGCKCWKKPNLGFVIRELI